MLHAGDLVPRRTVVLGYLGLDNDLRVELAGNDEIRRLIEAGDTLCPFRLTEANAGAGKYALNGAFQHIAHKLADRIPMPGERAAEKALVEQHCIRNAEIRERLNAGEPMPRIGLVEPVQVLAEVGWHAFR
jgi:hypothetical protein